MLKNHPKGLLVAFFTNMGERFGFYTMMAILVMFLQARYGLDADSAGSIYSWFYFAIYALALIGGMLADWTKKYKTVIFVGQVVMFAGYCIIAIPGSALWVSVAALMIIALGNGLFKGNLQAVVGQMYDEEKYKSLRESAFMIFYMGINIGAFFAPFVAKAVKDFWLKTNGYIENANLPSLCHQYINGTLKDTTQLQKLANEAILPDGGKSATDLAAFTSDYINVFSTGFNYAFGVAAAAMIISLLVYSFFGKVLPNKYQMHKEAGLQNLEQKTESKPAFSLAHNLKSIIVPLILMAAIAVLFWIADQYSDLKDINYKLGLAVGLFVAFVTMIFRFSTKEERPRVVALTLVFVVVIFFWMSFHQNGLTLTMFARDYTKEYVDPYTNLLFNLGSILSIAAAIVGCVMIFNAKKTLYKGIGALVFLGFGYLCYYLTTTYSELNRISPEIFQSFNPLYIVILTPLVMGVFAMLRKKGKEPSSPKKIGIGMIIAALGFVLVLFCSMGLVSPKDMAGAAVTEADRVSPYWLISSYLVLTIAELFLSPIGLSFVAKVAPPRFQGLMQGGWLLATAIGNKFLFVGSLLWGKIDLYMLWGIFIICCILSAIFIFSIMKRLERVAK
ncbi:MAG: peptide MFS transporter [Chitinophagaceae bacterium]|nr:peptide MFS transporter [Chitinophagaceae bacterium]MBK8952069.1 peptide MFS transporter [Chitinophagaceae bacterium]